MECSLSKSSFLLGISCSLMIGHSVDAYRQLFDAYRKLDDAYRKLDD